MLLHVGMITHLINCYSTAHTVGGDRGSDIDEVRGQHGTITSQKCGEENHPLTRWNPDHQKTGNLVLRTAQGTEPTRSMASTTSVPAGYICGGSRTLHLQCSPQIKGRARRKSCQMKIQHPLIQDSMLHGSFVTTSTLHNDCKMHTRKAYEFHGNSATVNHP